ncbi:MAG: response regulator [Methylococcaceae bacterium]|nr:response regulator [Methylococcaceae bacterium]
MSTNTLTKILYAEDEEDIREIAILAIESIGGFEIASRNSGEGVIELARSFSPQLILLDVMMPVMDGPATLAALRQEDDLKHIPIIFLTAKIMDQEIQGFKELGAIDIISKPFDPMTLAEQIQAIWDTQHV